MMMNSFSHPGHRSVFCFLLIYFIMSQFSFSSLNLNGARDAVKRALLYELMKAKGTDVMFVQETQRFFE